MFPLKYFTSYLSENPMYVSKTIRAILRRTEYVPTDQMLFRQSCNFCYTLKRKDQMKSAKFTLMKILSVFLQSIKFCKA